MENGYENILVDRDGPVGILKFNRPKRLNAMSVDLRDEVIDALDRFEEDDEIRAVVWSGEGRAFSAGYDIYGEEDKDNWGVIEWRESLEHAWNYARRVWEFKKPLIAAVHGYALAGACEIAMLCDMTISAESCQFGEPEIRFATSSTLIMPWVVPMKAAKELIMSGRMISAQRAYEIGMVNEVVPDGEEFRRAMYYAQMMSRIAPLATQLTKEGLNRTYEIQGLPTALHYHENLTAILDGSETEEGKTFNKIRAKEGLRAAMDWRDEQFREVEEKYGN